MVLLSLTQIRPEHPIPEELPPAPGLVRGVNLGANGPQYGVLVLAIKALEQPLEPFTRQVLAARTPEPTGWMTTWTDNRPGGLPHA